jgi:tetratricopeptide (TPR) repeat protein
MMKFVKDKQSSMTPSVLKIVFLVSAFLLVASCAGNKSNTLGALKYKPKEKEEKIEFKKLNHQEVRKEYKELLDVFEDKELKEQIERRIADVYMMEGVQDQNKQKQKSSYYVDAIKAYRNILEKYPDSPDNAEVLYQLAKAYDLEGNQVEALKMLNQLTSRHPSHPNITEAYFRKGDIYFNNKDFRNAEQSYLAVTQLDKNKLAINAHYMLGWTYYKQTNFQKGLDSFAYVLDQLMGDKPTTDHLGKAELPLVKDTLHSITLTLDRIGGAEVIGTMKNVASKSYAWMLYEDVGDYYLEKELFEDSATAFRLYVNNHPNSEQAPQLHEKLINTYIKGNFPRQALDEKEAYVAAYGIRSNYAGNRGGMKEKVKQSIRIYLDELARFYYNEGQGYQKDIAEAAKDDKKKNEKSKDEKKLAEASAASVVSFDRAANFYQEYADTFPDDVRIDEIYFLKAESLFQANRFSEAIADYERVAYKPKGKSAQKHAANAGYAAIISYQKHIQTLTGKKGDEVKKWQAQAVDSMLLFAKTFDTDSRSPTVLTNAAEYLFSLNQYQRALEVSQGLINNNPKLDKLLKKTAYGIVAHSYFKLEDYQNAENNYLNQRNLTEKTSEEYKQISERLATSIYKKSEGIVKTGEKLAAAEQLLKIKTLTPDSTVRVTAQYDATTMLLELSLWQRAIVELKELSALFPKHELAVEFPRKLAFAYEKNESWTMAAETYLGLSAGDPDPTIKREALFLAATMYEKSKNYTAAIEQFKNYNTAYEKPLSARLEARYNLAMLYEKLDDKEKQLFWLKSLIEGDQKGGSERTDRSRWLGAWASIKYGDHYAANFSTAKLYLPLVKSLPVKKQLFEVASNQYQTAADYGILEFVTMSSFKTARLYQEFAVDLRQSPRPAGMSDDEQALYAEIIEEQAVPFDQLAVQLHQANIDRAWDGQFNEWIDKSFVEMRNLSPERFNKVEQIVSYGDEIR